MIEPRDDAIARMQATLQDMDSELLRDISQKKNAELLLADLQSKKLSGEKINQELKIKLVTEEAKIRDLLRDIQRWCTEYTRFTLDRNLRTPKQPIGDFVNNGANFVSLDNKHHEFITALKIIYSKHVDTLLQNQLKARIGNAEVLGEHGESFKLQKSKYQSE